MALGLSERRAVGLLYILAAVGGLTAYVVHGMPIDVGLLVIAAVVVPLTLLGIYLAEVKVYEQIPGPEQGRPPLAAFLVDLSHKRRLFEVLLDVILIGLAYYAANIVYFGPLSDQQNRALLIRALPLVVPLKLLAFLSLGVYRGLWRFVTINDLLLYIKAVVLGSILSTLALLFLVRFEDYSRTVFVLDGLFLLIMVVGSRLTFRVLRNLLPGPAVSQGRRVLIFGAGDAGMLLLREMRNNPRLGCVPVGFADDDPIKCGKVIGGVRVFGGNGSLQSICRTQNVEEVYISTGRISKRRMQEILEECGEAGVEIKQLCIGYRVLQPTDVKRDRRGEHAHSG